MTDKRFHLVSDLPDVSKLSLTELLDPKFDVASEAVLELVRQEKGPLLGDSQSEEAANCVRTNARKKLS